MNKLITDNGNTYSLTDFGDYEFRIKVTGDRDNEYFSIDVYTDCKSKEDATEFLNRRLKKKCKNVKIVNWATKKQDEIASKLIDEWIKETE